MAKKQSKSRRDYFGMSRLLSVIFAIIPITSLIFGFIIRLSEKHYLAAVLRLLLGWNIIWILDIILVAFKGRILRIL